MATLLNESTPLPEHPTVNILIVDDLPEKQLVFTTILEELGENLIGVSSGREALQQILLHDFAVILLDVNMPDIDGFETAALIRQYHRTRQTPIIFVTAYLDDMQTVRGYALGAVDYISAPVVPEILRSKVQVFVDLHRMHLQLQQQAVEREALARAEAARASAEAATRRADLLAEASHTLGRSLDIDETATALLQFLTRTAADTALVALSDPQQQIQCVLLAQRRPHYAQQPLAALPEPFASYLARPTGTALDPFYLAGARKLVLQGGNGVPLSLPIAGAAIFPLAYGPRFHGFVALLDRDSQTKFPSDPPLLREVISRAAIAFENALLYRTILEGDRRKGEFLAMLAHELRNPLAPIRNAVRVLQHEHSTAADVGWAGGIIARQVDHMARLMDDLLDVSRIGQGKLALEISTVFIAEFIAHSVEAVQPLINERQHRLTVDLPPYPVAVQGDAVRLAQIVSNLLHNAAKYSPMGSSIDLQISFAEASVRILVRDNGEGIAPELLPTIFDMFTQGEKSIDRMHGGLGVGLTLVKLLTELHGGTVQVHSDGPGRGAEFTVQLPARRTFAVAETPRPAATPTPASQDKYRVLVVDDLRESAESMARLLTLKGFDVATAFDGHLALEQAARAKPDVILLDIGMPGMDGYEVARQLRELHGPGALLLIALTGYGAEEDLQRASSAGFDAHFVKPVDIERLLALLDDYRAQNPRAERAAQTSV